MRSSGHWSKGICWPRTGVAHYRGDEPAFNTPHISNAQIGDRRSGTTVAEGVQDQASPVAATPPLRGFSNTWPCRCVRTYLLFHSPCRLQ